jgi:hypothetical protein
MTFAFNRRGDPTKIKNLLHSASYLILYSFIFYRTISCLKRRKESASGDAEGFDFTYSLQAIIVQDSILFIFLRFNILIF